MSKKPTTKDVAVFMKTQFDKNKFLYQENIVYKIKDVFGSDFVYVNINGNFAIDRKVLTEFKKITPNAVWERGEYRWRKREEFDQSNSRMQD